MSSKLIITIILIITIYLFINNIRKNNEKKYVYDFMRSKLNDEINCVKVFPICVNHICYHKCITYINKAYTEVYIWSE